MKHPLILTPNHDVGFSYSFARSFYVTKKNGTEDPVPEVMSIHEMRVVLRAMEIISREIAGERLDELIGTKVTPTQATYEFTIPIKDAFFSDLSNDDVELELLHLLARTMQARSADKKIWWACTYIEHPKVNRGEGTFSFGIYKPFAEFLLNFKDGYPGFRLIEINIALGLDTAYSMKFYFLMSGEKRPFIYMSIEEMKEWLNISKDKYRDKNGRHRIDNLEKAVIIPAQNELNAKSPWTFTYKKRRKHPNNKRSQVIGFEFYPVAQPNKRDPKLEENSLISKTSKIFLILPEVKSILQDKFEFSSAELDSNKQTIVKWENLMKKSEKKPLEAMVSWLNKKYEKVINDDSIPGKRGWLINGMKAESELMENKLKGVVNPVPEEINKSSNNPENQIKAILAVINNKLDETGNKVFPRVKPETISQTCKERFMSLLAKWRVDQLLEVICNALEQPFFQNRQEMPNGNLFTPNLTWMLNQEPNPKKPGEPSVWDKIVVGDFDKFYFRK